MQARWLRRKYWTASFSVGVLWAAVGLSCQPATPEGPTGSSPEPLKGGAPSNCYPQVVQITASDGASCTGTVIGNGLVLTAAHCIEIPAHNGYPMTTVSGLGGTAEITQAYVDPFYDRCRRDTWDMNDDLAVVRIKGNVLPPGVGPAQLGTPEVGATYQTIGYGLPNVGERRQGAFTVQGSYGDDDPTVNPGSWLELSSTNAAACGGDSGAPLLRTLKDGSGCDGIPPPTVVGTHTDSGCQLGATSEGTNVAASSDFVNNALAGTATPFDPASAAPTCCTTGDQNPLPTGATQSCVDASGCPGNETCQANNTWSDCVADACCGDPCCGDPCCGDPCCGDPCCGDPCCGSSDPCCGSSDPCCGSSDPCCGSSDPCCGSSDPCCGNPDPCCGVYCPSPSECSNGACVDVVILCDPPCAGTCIDGECYEDQL